MSEVPEVQRAPVLPPVRSFSILPAAAVLILAVGTLLSFVIIDWVVSPNTTTTTVPVVLGGLRIGSAATSHAAFADFYEAGEPPANIAGALIVPTGTTRITTDDTGGGGPGDYDDEVTLGVADAPARVLGFYRSNLVARGWSLFSSGTSPTGSPELLFSKNGDDGFQWEAGVVVASSSAAHASYTFRLLQVSDDD